MVGSDALGDFIRKELQRYAPPAVVPRAERRPRCRSRDLGSDRVLGSDAARAVGRFRPDGPLGYRAKSVPDAPLRDTRAEAVADEAAWWKARDEENQT